MDILPGFLQVCKIQEADNWIDSLLGGTEKDEKERWNQIMRPMRKRHPGPV